MGNWSRQHEIGIERVLQRIRRDARPFVETGEGARAGRRGLPFLSWCQTYLPHYFDRPFAPFHRRMAEAVGEPGMPTFVAAFRGAGKSVMLALARPLWRMLGGQCPYILFGSQVRTLAAQNMDYLRLELEHNPRIRCDYGPLRVEGPESCWTVELLGSSRRGGFSSCRLEAFGIGMSPRGRRFRQHRPWEFVGDDLESAELARNPEREKQLWDWLMDEVLPALEPGRFTFTVLGTMFGPGCMVERARRLSQRADRKGRPLARLFLQSAMEGGRSVWPERFPEQVLSRIRRTVGLRNWLRNFALLAEDPDKPFQAAWLGSYDPSRLDTSRLDVVCFLDPALSESPRGCPRALVAVGADRDSGIRYVLDAWIGRGSPMKMLDKLIEFNRRHAPRVIGVEANGGYALIKPLLRMRAPRAELPVRYVTHRVPKDIRIERLAPRFEAGMWRFPRDPAPGVQALQEQLLAYPDGFVDGPDALAGCEELLPAGPEADGAFAYTRLESRRDLSAL